MMIY